MFLIHILEVNTDLELACYCIQRNILDQISVTLSKNFWNAWIQWLRELTMNFWEWSSSRLIPKLLVLKVQPKLDNTLGWNLKIFCDSDWAGDPETRVSVTGFITYLLNLPICWRSKSQKGVTLSSTDAKYVAVSEAIKELKFIYYLLSDLHIKVNLPIVMKTDNIRAIFMSKMALLKLSLSVQLKMTLIYLRRTLIRSCMWNTRRNFWKKLEFTVPVDCYRIGRVIEISFAINNSVLHV
jgi:hypothetical protein